MCLSDLRPSDQGGDLPDNPIYPSGKICLHSIAPCSEYILWDGVSNFRPITCTKAGNQSTTNDFFEVEFHRLTMRRNPEEQNIEKSLGLIRREGGNRAPHYVHESQAVISV